MSDIGRLWLFHESYGFKVIPPPMDYDSFVKLLLICANGDGRITAPEREGARRKSHDKRGDLRIYMGLLCLFDESYVLRVIPPPMDYDSFVKLLLICANGDGRITAPEREWIVGWVDAFGGPASALDLC